MLGKVRLPDDPLKKSANGALFFVVPSGGAELSGKVDDLKVELIPA